MGTTADALLEIFRGELADDGVSADDDFYAVGGDSLIAVRVVASARDRGMPIELIDLLQYPSVAELAELLAERAESSVRATADPPLSAEDRAALPPGVSALPASALQVGLIYQCEMTDDTALFNDLIGMRVTMPFEEGRFRTALRRLHDRHSALRSWFDLGGYSRALQLWRTEGEPDLEIHRAGSGTEAEAAREAWRDRQLGEPFSWEAPPLCRCHVATAGDHFLLSMAMHHAIIDGWSFATVLADLLDLYDAELAGREHGLPPVPDYGHEVFREAEAQILASPAAAAFWRSQADAPPLLLDRARFAEPARPSVNRFVPLDPADLAGLRKAAAEARVPLKSLLLAVHCRSLGDWTGRTEDVVSGVVMNGRPEIPGSELLVGLFLNTVPIRMRDTSGEWPQLATDMYVAELTATPYRRYPLASIEQQLGRSSFDVFFNFTNFHVYTRTEHLNHGSVDNWWSTDRAGHPMSCDYTIDFPGFGTGVIVNHDPDLIPPTRIDAFLATLQTNLISAARTRP